MSEGTDTTSNLESPKVIPWAQLKKQADSHGVEIEVYIESMNAHIENQRRELAKKNQEIERLRNDMQELTCGDARYTRLGTALLGLCNHKGEYRDGSAADLWAQAYSALDIERSAHETIASVPDPTCPRCGWYLEPRTSAQKASEQLYRLKPLCQCAIAADGSVIEIHLVCPIHGALSENGSAPQEKV